MALSKSTSGGNEMNLERAIELLISGSELSTPWLLTGYERAREVAIEALRECIRARAGNPRLAGELLPGETEGKNNE